MQHSETLASIHRQLQDFSETLRALSDQWSRAEPVVVRWDEQRKVLATDRALGTYRAIYGNDLVRALRYFWKSTAGRSPERPDKQSQTSFLIDAPFPADAVLVPQRSQASQAYGYVLTIVSGPEKRVVKIFSKERKSRFENELNALRLAQAAGIGHRVPELLASGELPNGFCWVTSRLVPNSGILHPPIIADWLWRRFLVREILPDLQRFYHRSGVEVVTGGDFLKSQRLQIEGHPMSAALHQLAELAEKARRYAADDRIALAVVHGDLRPHNVHRHGSRWWLIDWSMSRRAPLVLDLWPNIASAATNHAFSAWLRGSTTLDNLPRNMRLYLTICAEWQASCTSVTAGPGGLRFQILATLLHRLSRNHWSGRSPANVTILEALGIGVHAADANSMLSLAT